MYPKIKGIKKEEETDENTIEINEEDIIPLTFNGDAVGKIKLEVRSGGSLHRIGIFLPVLSFGAKYIIVKDEADVNVLIAVTEKGVSRCEAK